MGNRTHQHVAKDVVGFVVVEVLVGQAAADVAEDCGVPAGAQDIINHVLRVHRHTRHARRGASSGSCVGCRRGRSAARLYVLALTQPLCRLLSSQSCVMLGRTVNSQALVCYSSWLGGELQQDSPYDSRAAKACNGTTLAAHLQSCTTMHNSMHPWWLTSRSDMRCLLQGPGHCHPRPCGVRRSRPKPCLRQRQGGVRMFRPGLDIGTAPP